MSAIKDLRVPGRHAFSHRNLAPAAYGMSFRSMDPAVVEIREHAKQSDNKLPG